jgi:hypothetical protein
MPLVLAIFSSNAFQVAGEVVPFLTSLVNVLKRAAPQDLKRKPSMKAVRVTLNIFNNIQCSEIFYTE